MTFCAWRNPQPVKDAICFRGTRKVLARRIFNTLAAAFCIEALNEAIHKFGPPEIMNTDQGSQFTSFDRTDRLKRAKTRISMGGKARFPDNPRAFLRCAKGTDPLGGVFFNLSQIEEDPRHHRPVHVACRA